jgi:glycine cleavage system H protein
MNPKEYKYTKDHEWLKIDGDIVTIGITSWAQEQLGDIVSVEFPDIGSEFAAGDSAALIDSMKTTSDVYAPISGEIAEVNTKLEDQPELMNEDPYHEGWILKMKVKDPSELQGLLSSEDYEALLEKEGEEA